MRFLEKASIKRKQMFVILLTTSIALLLACAAFITYEVFTFRTNMVRNLSTLAEITGNNTSVALDFGDADAAAEILSTLRVESHLIGASIYTKEGKMLATYEREDTPGAFKPPGVPELNGHSFGNGRLALTIPVGSKGEIVGSLYLESDMEALYSRLRRYGAIVGGVFSISLLIALLISSRLQQMVSEPILGLVQTARAVARDRDYSVRVTRRTHDEIGDLVDSFNEMLAQIQKRDAVLQIAQGELERRVAERTQEFGRERDLLQTLLDSSPDYIYFKDRNSRFLRCSRSLAERFGLRAEELVGKSDFDLYTEEHARPAFEDEQKIITSGNPIVGKIEKEVWKQGEIMWVLTSKIPLRSQTGEIIGTFGLSKDITVIKEAETRLELVHKQLLETSRMAGMAEVATSVLHNVGNVLNSVNVSCAVVSDQIRKSRIGNLSKVAILLESNEQNLACFFADDPKGRQLPGYLKSLAAHLAAEQGEMLRELTQLAGNIDHIKEIVAMQQSYSKVSGVREALPPDELVEDALRMNGAAMDRHQIKVVRDYSATPPVVVERHKVLQILVNVLRNAKYACDDCGRPDKQITVRVAVNGNQMVKIAVVDNGVGIPPENLTRIFEHGFTTRKDGHGFGLHSGALAARELGGVLAAHSDGPGKGAIFTLELPCELTEHRA